MSSKRGFAHSEYRFSTVTPQDNLTRRKKTGPPLSGVKEWLVITKDGRSYTEEMGKHTIMRRTCLLARDLRLLDPLLAYPSSILARDEAIVINLEHIKAVITASEVLIPNGRDPLVEPMVKELLARLDVLQNSNNELEPVTLQDLLTKESSFRGKKLLPFEFRSLEVCLESACNSLGSDSCELEKEAYPALDELTSKVSTLNLERIRKIKSRYVALAGRVQKIRDEVERLLEDDVDMAMMHLSEKLIHKTASTLSERFNLDEDSIHVDGERNDAENVNHDSETANETTNGFDPNLSELEMLLEAYFAQIEGTLNKLSILKEYIDDTEDYINILLDDKQNQLLQMGVMLNTATMIATCGIVVTGFMSINIHIPLYEPSARSAEVFWDVICGVVAGGMGLFIFAYVIYKKRGFLQ
ncbi:hypothetical protein LUZ60_000369 [Juncus effusus]|nr:hypothetical protein LUZ60_000369 [Juncus effusus]